MRKVPAHALCGILFWGCVLGCESADPNAPVPILAQAYNIPLAAVRLESRAGLMYLPMIESDSELSFDLRKTPPANPGSFSFVLILQPGSPMLWLGSLRVLVLSIAAFDASNCLIGSGVGSLRLGTLRPEVSPAALSVELRQFSSPDCAGTRELVLHDVTPALSGFCGNFAVPSSSPLPQEFCVSGWGFHPTSQLMVDNFPLRKDLMTWTSASSIIVNRLNRSGRLRIINPDGKTAELANVSF